MKVRMMPLVDFCDAFVAIDGTRLDLAASVSVDDQGDFLAVSLEANVERGETPWPERGRVVRLNIAMGSRVLSTSGWRARVDESISLNTNETSVAHFVCAPAEWVDVEREGAREAAAG